MSQLPFFEDRRRRVFEETLVWLEREPGIDEEAEDYAAHSLALVRGLARADLLRHCVPCCRDIRQMRIYEGASEVQKLILGRRVLEQFATSAAYGCRAPEAARPGAR